MNNAQRWQKAFAVVAIIELIAIVGAASTRDWSNSPHEPRYFVWLGFCCLFGLATLTLVVLFAFYLVFSTRSEDPMLRLARYLSAGANLTGKDYPGVTVVPDYQPPVDGPGRYRIEGVDRRTERDATLDIDAESAANAKVKAELKNIVVTSVTKIV